MTADPEVLPEIIARQASERPDKPFAIFPDGGAWTYGELPEVVQPVMASLRSLGVGQGDVVFTWLPNGPDFLRVWFGVNCLGAIQAPCNLSWRGAMLDHAVRLSRARVAIVHADLLERLREVEHHALEHVIVVGETAIDLPGVKIWAAVDVFRSGETIIPMATVFPWTTMQHIFTSGTTGASKAVASSYRQAARFLAPPDPGAMGEQARFLLVLPLFHAGGIASVYAILRAGGTVVVPQTFRTDEFWPVVRGHDVTSTTLVEQMATFLLARDPLPDDAENPLRHVNIAPMREAAYAFAERFGATLWSSYGSTEVGGPVVSEPDPAHPGVTGWLRPGYEALIADENDIAVGVGVSGQLLLRANEPWTMMTGYAGDGDATASAWRNGWFHTGDIFRQDAQGRLYFIDRAKDCIRRRGENISSQEVEREVSRCSWIAACAAYPVRGDASEDEVMVCVETDDDPDWPPLIEFLRRAMPHYMVPRYFRTMRELPRTANGKIRKDGLRAEGVTIDTWDREAYDIDVKSERVALS